MARPVKTRPTAIWQLMPPCSLVGIYNTSNNFIWFLATTAIALRNKTHSKFIYDTTSLGHALALRYKPVGRGFDSRCCHWNFFIDIILPAAL